MTTKISDRLKHVEDGNNRYTAPKIKPPRRNESGNRHRKKDPLDIEDEKKDKEMDKNSTKEVEAAKRIARKKIKTAYRTSQNDYASAQQREGLDGYKFKDKGIRAVAKTYKHLADSFLNLTKAVNTFTSCKSSEISPDGKLGGKGYIQPITGIRKALAECLNNLSELLDTFHDEVNSPYWKRTTTEDHPIVKEILEKADDIIDQAEDLDGQVDPKEPDKVVLSDEEKTKVLTILKNKGY